ncbi:MAG: geranylgeranylglycerol-phosphate geranylgeranyltransferase [Candidatus Bathyarchaeia archaeon]
MRLEKAVGIVRLIRVKNCMLMGLAVIVGYLIACRGGLQYGVAAVGFFVAFTLTAATMAFNDYRDVKIDEINEPLRPIPSGAVSPREALTATFLLASAGIVLAAFINVFSLLVAALALILMIYYNVRGKRTGFPGNIAVSACVAIPFIFGGAMNGRITSLIAVFSSMAFASNLGREVIKGIVDVEGDRLAGVKTLPILLGAGRSAVIASMFILTSVGLSVVPLLTKSVSIIYLPFIAAADAGFIWSAYRVVRRPNSSEARTVKNHILIWMLLGLLGFLTGSAC